MVQEGPDGPRACLNGGDSYPPACRPVFGLEGFSFDDVESESMGGTEVASAVRLSGRLVGDQMIVESARTSTAAFPPWSDNPVVECAASREATEDELAAGIENLQATGGLDALHVDAIDIADGFLEVRVALASDPVIDDVCSGLGVPARIQGMAQLRDGD